MMKLKSFFVGILLLIIVFIMVVVTALVYRANERSSIRSYIFQMGNAAWQRVGELQNINTISEIDLRNKLIAKYISEYFKVIPGESDVTNRPVLKNLSSGNVYTQWQNNEAKQIAAMSEKNMFRMVQVYDDGIAVLNKTANINYKTSDVAPAVYYIVRYDVFTWSESNIMKTEPRTEQGTIYIEARFKPDLLPNEAIQWTDRKGKTESMSLREYLESGNDPVGLFMFKVTKIGDEVIR